jgi:hypothetical protein
MSAGRADGRRGAIIPAESVIAMFQIDRSGRQNIVAPPATTSGRWSMPEPKIVSFTKHSAAERYALISVIQRFLLCQASDGTKCAPNDEDFVRARAVLSGHDVREVNRET